MQKSQEHWMVECGEKKIRGKPGKNCKERQMRRIE